MTTVPIHTKLYKTVSFTCKSISEYMRLFPEEPCRTNKMLWLSEDKERALALLQQDTIEMEEVSKRWASDMQSDSWLSKNTRPLALIFLTISMVLLIFVDSMGVNFDVDSGWVDLLKSLLITVYVAYFGSRGAEKFKTISK